MNPDIENLFDQRLDSCNYQYWMDIASKDKAVFNTFWEITKGDKYENNWRALWIIENAIKKDKNLLNDILFELYQLIVSTDNNSLRRMALKLICKKTIINDDISSKVLNKCESFILNNKIPVAVRANAIQYFYQFCKIEKDLINELIIILDHISEQENTPAMISKIKNTRKAIAKIR